MSIHPSNDFAALIDANKGLIYKVANSYCRDDEERRDLIQEIVIQLWTSFASYDPQFKLSTWMYRVALNVAISYYRRDKKRQDHHSPFSESLLNVEDSQEDLLLTENISLLQQFISQLKPMDKALMLLYLDDRSYREIGEILAISETNVATKVGRIKEKLKQRFAENGK